MKYLHILYIHMYIELQIQKDTSNTWILHTRTNNRKGWSNEMLLSTIHTKVVTTAACIVPPESVWPKIQELRKVHDKAFPRWMPHINLMFPFVPHEYVPLAQKEFAKVLLDKHPFEITFCQFKHFAKGDQCIVWLQPESQPADALQDVYKAMVKVIPICGSASPFVPHLSVGQWPRKDIAETLRRLQAAWVPITFTAANLKLVSRGPYTNFSVTHTIPFGGSCPVSPVSPAEKALLPSGKLDFDAEPWEGYQVKKPDAPKRIRKIGFHHTFDLAMYLPEDLRHPLIPDDHEQQPQADVFSFGIRKRFVWADFDECSGISFPGLQALSLSTERHGTGALATGTDVPPHCRIHHSKKGGAFHALLYSPTFRPVMVLP